MTDIHTIHKNLKEGKHSCISLVEEKLQALKKNINNTANSVLTDSAREKAAEIDSKIQKGMEIGLLEGIPFGLKDVFLLQGTMATASSDFIKNYKAPYTATAIQKLMDKGAIPIVRENCDCYGHGSSSENTVFGPVKNALDENLVAGGSSGGSAVNVAKGNTIFSIGGDTGGSIRQPAGFNQVYGLKPTYGRISRYGLMAYASSTDCVGPIANTIEDIRILVNTMSGKDIHDQTTIDTTEISENIFSGNTFNANIRVGFYKSFIEDENIDLRIKEDFLILIDKLRNKNINLKELDFYNTDILVSTYYAIAMAETASNLARLDGTNYGARNNAQSLKEGYAITRSVNFTEETQRRIVGGNQVLSHGHAEEIYIKARTLRNKLTQSFNDVFKKVDIILSPVSPNLPPNIGESLKDPLKMYLSDAFTVGFSLGGLPTLTAPLGTGVGIQITAAKFQEEEILKFANFLNDIA